MLLGSQLAPAVTISRATFELMWPILNCPASICGFDYDISSPRCPRAAGDGAGGVHHDLGNGDW